MNIPSVEQVEGRVRRRLRATYAVSLIERPPQRGLARLLGRAEAPPSTGGDAQGVSLIALRAGGNG